MFSLSLLGFFDKKSKMSSPLKQRESSVEKAVCKYALKSGWEFRKQAGQGQRGKLDRFFIKEGGKLIFVEFKAPGKTATQLQEIELAKLKDHGFLAVVIDNEEEGTLLFDYLNNEVQWHQYRSMPALFIASFDDNFRTYVSKNEESF